MKNSILILALSGLIFSCDKPIQEESNPTYSVQLYAKKDSKLAISLGREFGKLTELKNEYITNDSSAYIWAWKMTENVRQASEGSSEETKDIFSNVNEFKLYNEIGLDITNSVSFEGIENYPNPVN